MLLIASSSSIFSSFTRTHITPISQLSLWPHRSHRWHSQHTPPLAWRRPPFPATCSSPQQFAVHFLLFSSPMYLLFSVLLLTAIITSPFWSRLRFPLGLFGRFLGNLVLVVFFAHKRPRRVRSEDRPYALLSKHSVLLSPAGRRPFCIVLGVVSSQENPPVTESDLYFPSSSFHAVSPVSVCGRLACP